MSLYEFGQKIVSATNTTSAIRYVPFGLILLFLTGCGFQPLYGVSSNSIDGSVQEELKKVEIAKIPGRVGQKVRNELIYQTTTGGHPLPPEYKLVIVVRERVAEVLVRTDGDSQARIYRLTAQFKLFDPSQKVILIKGQSNVQALYDTRGDETASVFANERARLDAENRAARTIADEIKTRIASYLATSA